MSNSEKIEFTTFNAFKLTLRTSLEFFFFLCRDFKFKLSSPWYLATIGLFSNNDKKSF